MLDIRDSEHLIAEKASFVEHNNFSSGRQVGYYFGCISQSAEFFVIFIDLILQLLLLPHLQLLACLV